MRVLRPLVLAGAQCAAGVDLVVAERMPVVLFAFTHSRIVRLLSVVLLLVLVLVPLLRSRSLV